MRKERETALGSQVPFVVELADRGMVLGSYNTSHITTIKVRMGSLGNLGQK
jgi:hypothetical protein